MIVTANIYARKSKTIVCRIRSLVAFWTGSAWSSDPSSAALTTLSVVVLSSNQFENLYYGEVDAPEGSGLTLEYIDNATGLVIAQEVIGGGTVASVTQGALQVANMALISLGCQPIQSFADTTTEAVTVNSCYDILRNEVLRSHPWSFATRRATLSATTAPEYGYSRAFALPVYCVRILEITFPNRPDATPYTFGSTSMGRTVPFRIEGRTIVTDESAVTLKYISRDIEPDVYDTLFTSALTARIIAELAYPLTQSTSKEDMAWKKYTLIMAQARSADASEQPADDVQQSPLIDARSTWA